MKRIAMILMAIGALFSAQSDSSSDDRNSGYVREEVIYGRKFGVALTMDVFRPKAAANGAAVIFVVSEGWYSDHDKIDPNIPNYVDPFLAQGYTVFAVCHGGNPKFSLPEIIDDLHRSVRFIRHHANRYGIDGQRIGSTGDSAGAHLSLILGCAGGPGDAAAPDPVDRESSAVQAVVSFFAPTDFLNWGTPGTRMLGQHPIVPLKGAFDFQKLDPETNSFVLITNEAEREEIGRQVSPITHVKGTNAPTLLLHGDADEFIPLQQAQIMAARFKAAGVTSQLVIKPGGGHDEPMVREHIPLAVEWFNKHLSKKVTQ